MLSRMHAHTQAVDLAKTVGVTFPLSTGAVLTARVGAGPPAPRAVL